MLEGAGVMRGCVGYDGVKCDGVGGACCVCSVRAPSFLSFPFLSPLLLAVVPIVVVVVIAVMVVVIAVMVVVIAVMVVVVAVSIVGVGGGKRCRLVQTIHQ